MRLSSIFAAIVVGATAFGFAIDVAVAGTISLSAGQTALPDIGKVIQSSPTSTGTFRVDAGTGSVSVISGSLSRVGGASVTVPTYTVTCTNGNGNGNACGNSPSSVVVTVSNPGSTGVASIAAFNASVTLGAGASSCGAISGQNTISLNFTCTVINGNPGNGNSATVVTVKVGMDISILSVATTGKQNPGYTVSTNP